MASGARAPPLVSSPPMTPDVFGQLSALSAAFVWAFALILFKTSGERVRPIPLNVFKNCIGLTLFGATLGIQALSGYDHGWSRVEQLSRSQLLVLAVSGILGIAVADTLVFYGLNLAGVGMTIMVDCIYTPSIIFFSWMLLGEHLSATDFCGAAMILGGVLAASGHAPPVNRTRAQMLTGMTCGAMGIIAMTYGIVLAKPVLEITPPFWAATIRLCAGTIAMFLVAMAVPDRARLIEPFVTPSIWRAAVPAAALGTYLSLVLWVTGFTYTGAAIAGMLNQTSVIFALILAAILLKEPLTVRKLLAVGLSFSGVVLVTVVRART